MRRFTASHPPLLSLMAIAVAILSIADLLLTVEGLRMGVISEANPFMRKMLEVSPALFVVVKVALTAFFLVVIVKWGDRAGWAWPLVATVFMAYMAVMAIHVSWMVLL